MQKRDGEEIVSEIVEEGTYSELLGAIGALLERARGRLAATANTTLVETYWQTGLPDLHNAVMQIELEPLSGNPEVCRRDENRVLRGGMRAVELGRAGTTAADEVGAVRAVGAVEEGVLAVARRGNEVQRSEDILRDPYVLEFSGIRPQERFREKTLHAALVEHMKKFMLELGKGFAFVASEYRIPLNTTNPCRVDLVFYNYFLKCFVLVDLKRGAVEYGDVGQMNMYLNNFKSEEGTPSDNPPIGIVLGAKKDDLVVQFATEGITNRIFISRYQLYLPDKEQLRSELARAIAAQDRQRGK